MNDIDAQIVQAMEAFQAETGEWPSDTSGDATKWVGFPTTWAEVRAQYRTDGPNLLALLIAVGALPGPDDITDAQLATAIAAYQAETGELPTTLSGDASKWIGIPITWSDVATRIRRKGTTLKLFLKTHFKQPRKRVPFPDGLLQACQAYRDKMGYWPTSNSGDASEWFGLPVTWAGVEGRMRREQGMGLFTFMAKQGIGRKMNKI